MQFWMQFEIMTAIFLVFHRRSICFYRKNKQKTALAFPLKKKNLFIYCAVRHLVQRDEVFTVTHFTLLFTGKRNN